MNHAVYILTVIMFTAVITLALDCCFRQRRRDKEATQVRFKMGTPTEKE